MTALSSAISWEGAREFPFAYVDGNSSVAFFEKSDAPEGRRRRINGVATAEEEDQQEETLVQSGIDWDYFLTKGFFNDNHDKTIGGVIGYPETVQFYRRGATLPDGLIAKANCTWVDGYLLEKDPRATTVWEKGLALQGTPRQLGFSIQGKALARSYDGKVVTKSFVRHCAVTHVPVLASTRANLISKSLSALENATPADLDRAWEAFEKAISLGEPSITLPEGELTGEGIARILARRDEPGSRKKKRRKRVLTKAQSIEIVGARYPGISTEKARRVVELIERRWRQK